MCWLMVQGYNVWLLSRQPRLVRVEMEANLPILHGQVSVCLWSNHPSGLHSSISPSSLKPQKSASNPSRTKMWGLWLEIQPHQPYISLSVRRLEGKEGVIGRETWTWTWFLLTWLVHCTVGITLTGFCSVDLSAKPAPIILKFSISCFCVSLICRSQWRRGGSCVVSLGQGFQCTLHPGWELGGRGERDNTVCKTGWQFNW